MQGVRRHGVFAGGAADREQSLLQLLQFGGVEVGVADRRLQRVAGRVQRNQRGVDGGDARLDEMRRLGLPPIEPAQRPVEARHQPLGGEQLERVAQVADDLLGRLHVPATLGQHLLLAGLDGELLQLRASVPEEVGLGADRGDARLLGAAFGFEQAEAGVGLAHAGDLPSEAAEGVDQGAVGCRLDHGTIVVLAVDLHQRPADPAQHLRRHGLVVDKGAGAPVRHLHAAQDEFALGVDVVGGGRGAGGMSGGKVEGGGDLALGLALANQRTVAARAEREREGIEQDRLAGAGLAGEHGHARAEIEVEPVDQNDVADRQLDEHGVRVLRWLRLIRDGVARNRGAVKADPLQPGLSLRSRGRRRSRRRRPERT